MPNEFFHIDMLPGREGDCVWLEYGDDAKTHRVLIDGGRMIAYDTLKARFAALPQDERTLDLLVLTHVDADHIEGLLELLEDPDLAIGFDDVWFNGFVHLKRPSGTEVFGAKQGERFTDGLVERGWAWNRAFSKHSVVVPDDGDLPVKTLPGGMKLTLLSPTWDKLEKLRPQWQSECERAGIVPNVAPVPDPPEGVERFGPLSIQGVQDLAAGERKRDTSKANAASIALLAEFGGKRAILSGDAHADVVLTNLKRLAAGSQAIEVDAFKLSHHGSRGTLTPELAEKISTPRVLVSSDGSRHDHPDRQAIAQILVHSPQPLELIGNYRSVEMQEWQIQALMDHFQYSVRVPANADPDGEIRVSLGD